MLFVHMDPTHIKFTVHVDNKSPLMTPLFIKHNFNKGILTSELT